MKGRGLQRWIAAAIFLAGLTGCGPSLNPTALASVSVPLSDANGRISFDDMTYDPGLQKVIVGADGAGQLDLIDPDTLAVTSVSGFSKVDSTGANAGTTSSTVAHGLIYSLDKGVNKIIVIDPSSLAPVGAVDIKSPPDYIRFVAPTNELWVTETNAEQIEVFSLPSTQPAIPAAAGVISVPGGPEALAIDNDRGLAFTNQPTIGKTAVIQLQTHGIIAEWGNGCSQARGMAIDQDHGMLFVACKEGKVVMLDATNDGQQVTSQTYGGGLDFVAYNRKLHHLYLPSSASALLAIFSVDVSPAPTPVPSGSAAPTGGPTPGAPAPPAVVITLSRLGTADTAFKAKCVTADDRDQIWVCDQFGARLFLVKDTFPASSPDW